MHRIDGLRGKELIPKSKWISCFENYLWIKTFDFPESWNWFKHFELLLYISTENPKRVLAFARYQFCERGSYTIAEYMWVCMCWRWRQRKTKWNGVRLKHQYAMETHTHRHTYSKVVSSFYALPLSLSTHIPYTHGVVTSKYKKLAIFKVPISKWFCRCCCLSPNERWYRIFGIQVGKRVSIVEIRCFFFFIPLPFTSPTSLSHRNQKYITSFIRYARHFEWTER